MTTQGLTQPPGPGYWQASDGLWYPPEARAGSAPAVYDRPIGECRSAGMMILLAVVTLGIWTFVWTYQQHKEIKEYSGDGVGGGLGVFLYFLAGVVTYFLLPSEIDQMLRREGHTSPVTAVTGFWFLLPIVGSIIWYLKMQRTLNEFWQAHGAQPA